MEGNWNVLQNYCYASGKYSAGNPKMRNNENNHFLKSDLFRWRDIENEHLQKSHFFQWFGMMKNTLFQKCLFSMVPDLRKCTFRNSAFFDDATSKKYRLPHGSVFSLWAILKKRLNLKRSVFRIPSEKYLFSAVA